MSTLLWPFRSERLPGLVTGMPYSGLHDKKTDDDIFDSGFAKSPKALSGGESTLRASLMSLEVLLYSVRYIDETGNLACEITPGRKKKGRRYSD